MKTKIVRVVVQGGVAEVYGEIPKGITVSIKDYDCEGCEGGLEETTKMGGRKFKTHYHEYITEGGE